MPNTVPFYCLIKYWILHIAYISPALWLKMFVLFKFHDYTKLNLVGGDQYWMERDVPSPLLHFPVCPLKDTRPSLLNSILFWKQWQFFSEINSVLGIALQWLQWNMSLIEIKKIQDSVLKHNWRLPSSNSSKKCLKKSLFVCRF